MKIILLNGCPGSGKSEVFKIMAKRRAGTNQIIEEMKFAKPLNDIARTILPPMSDSDFMKWREPQKEEPLIIDGYDTTTTMRKLLIGISEDLIKPQFGNTYFGEVAVTKVLQRIEAMTDREWQCPNNALVFTDSGFQPEYDVFKQAMDKYHIPTQLIQIHRPEKSFDGDSREYVYGKNMWQLHNDENLNELTKSVYEMMDRAGL